jgi:hypothetical protein
MKNTILITVIFIGILAGSCKKNSTTATTTNTCTFKSVTYNYASCSYSPGSLEAISTSPLGSLSIGFYSGGPTSAGTYIVNNSGPDSSNQAEVVLVASTGNTYYGTGGNGSNQKINVSISSGKIGASASNIYLVNGSNPSDSALVTFNIIQTQ